MIYSEQTKKAMRIAFDAHKEQVDKAGLLYIFYPFHLTEQMNDEEFICVALLHDIVEDTEMTLNDLRMQGFSDRIMDALALLVHENDVEYMDYVGKIKHNRLATVVKLADLRHNSDAPRMDTLDDKARLRIEKYRVAMDILMSR